MALRPPSDPGTAGDAAPVGGEESVTALKAEIAALRARVAELTRPAPGGDVEDRLEVLMRQMMGSDGRGSSEQALRDSIFMLLSLIDNTPSFIFVTDVEGRHLLGNRRLTELFGMSRQEIVGKTIEELFPPEAAASIYADHQRVMAGGQPVTYEETVPTPTGEITALTIKFPIYDSRGTLAGICGIATEITALKRSEAERVVLQEKMITAQQAALQELSTPLVPIAEGVLAMPIVGAIDAVRARQILEALLDGISKQRAHTAIVDITGVRVVDSQVASALVGAARAARLLGARVVLTGIRPEVAQTLVGLGADLTGIVTLGTLQSGIAHALGR